MWFLHTLNELEDIASVTILHTTNFYKRTHKWGLSFGGSIWGEPFVMDGGEVPNGSKTTFSVTYTDGYKKIIKAKSGTSKYDRLMQLALDPPGTDFFSYNNANQKAKRSDNFTGGYIDSTPAPAVKTPPYKPIKLGENELPGGKYVIGKDIPPGAYDFTWVWGFGTFKLYKSSADQKDAMTYIDVGAEYDYQTRQILHVECEEGQLLFLDGNMVMKISKSPEIKLNL